jgi:formylglycine-generating enzyme required for sulfatase activity
MAGNVTEWVADCLYDELVYFGSPAQNPPCWALGEYRVLRGGSWCDDQRFVRAAVRDWNLPWSYGGNVGFRCARS